MRNKLIPALIFSLFSAVAMADAAPAAAPSTPPDQMVQGVVKSMFGEVNKDKDQLQKDPDKLYDVVGKALLPHFDFALASQLVLAQHWRTATEAQRKAFQDAFYSYLIRSYADALVKGNYSDRNVQVQPYRPGSDPNRAQVMTRVLPPNGQPVEVDFQLRNENGEWKAFDVVIEGISYVQSYRGQFGPEIQAKGLDELIQRLKTTKAPNAVTKPKG
ncbi:MAG TPA: ABC transporter substrate-binding protein [Gammaproteobacteria bacterium]